jgi:small-conductance mechanosensitive channel
MPVNILAQAFEQGLSSIPLGWTVVKITPIFAVLYLLKWYFNGAVNSSERNMHSKVVMVTVRHCMFIHNLHVKANVYGRVEQLA